MKTKIINLFLLGLLVVACNTSSKHNQSIPLSDINADFPIAEKIEFTPIHRFDIYEADGFDIKDSTLWLFHDDNHIVGQVYDLQTGELIAPIAASGRALNEIDYGWNKYDIQNDSIFFMYNYIGTIKGFALKDILSKIPMGERKVSIQTVPDSIRVGQLNKLPDGTVLIGILSFHDIQTRYQGLKDQSFAFFDGKNLLGFHPYPFEQLQLTTQCDDKYLIEDVLKMAFTQGGKSFKNNHEFAGTVNGQFIVYTFNKEKGKVTRLKKYTNIIYKEHPDVGCLNTSTENERNINISSIKTNNQYIVCMGSGYFTQEEAEAKKTKSALFVFDWNLNPIKRIDFTKKRQNPQNIMMYRLDLNNNLIYCMEVGKEGLVLYKADLPL